MKLLIPAIPGVVAVLLSSVVSADLPEFRLTIQNHRFEPAHLTIPAKQKVRLVVENLDATAEEFESHSLHREKIIPGHSKAVLYIGPLEAGQYEFFGEFNPKTATGAIIVK